MTDDKDNIKQFVLNLVPPNTDTAERDTELKDSLNKGVEIFNEEIKREGVQSFLAIILDNSESPIIIGAGDALPLKTLGALRATEDELLKGL